MAGAIRLRVLSIIHTHTHTQTEKRGQDTGASHRSGRWMDERNSPFGRTASRWTSARAKNFWFAHHSLPLCHIKLYMAHTHILESSQGRMSVDHHLFNWAFPVNNSLATNQGRPPSLSVSAHLDSKNNGKAIRQLSLIVDNEQFWPPSITDPFHKRQSLTRYSGPCCC